jgi:hypothetical protein
LPQSAVSPAGDEQILNILISALQQHPEKLFIFVVVLLLLLLLGFTSHQHSLRRASFSGGQRP